MVPELCFDQLPRLCTKMGPAENAPQRRKVNVGLNRVRFVHPVRVGCRVRSVATVGSVMVVAGGVQLVIA
jgi:acyl dehydratase